MPIDPLELSSDETLCHSLACYTATLNMDSVFMEQEAAPAVRPLPGHKKSTSSGSGILSKIGLMRPSTDAVPDQELDADIEEDAPAPTAEAIPSRALSTALQQQKTRRRRGSLRKVALLSRGAAQGDKRESRSTTTTTSGSATGHSDVFDEYTMGPGQGAAHDALGLSDGTSPRRFPGRTALATPSTAYLGQTAQAERDGDRYNAYGSTTDEEDVLQIPHGSSVARPGLSLSSGSDSYSATRAPGQNRMSFQQAKSPLSFSGLSSTTLPPPDSEWDYSETEWWGWVVLCVTWFVFVIGMGSCLDVWSWAWDVGKTPYAPPELEDDPTLPIVGYYPALIILTGVMAWVWVVIAWVGMKYFRHAKISGD